MSETTHSVGEPEPISTREWIKGLVFVAVTVGITIVLPLLLLYTAMLCGCETRPA